MISKGWYTSHLPFTEQQEYGVMSAQASALSSIVLFMLSWQLLSTLRSSRTAMRDSETQCWTSRIASNQVGYSVVPNWRGLVYEC